MPATTTKSLTPPTHESAQAKGTTSGPTTASTSFVDLEEMSVTITTRAASVFVMFSGTFSHSNDGGDQIVIIEVDGSDKAESERKTANTAARITELTTSWLGVLAAGSHTFKIQWKTSANTLTATGVLRSMQVIELV